MNKIGFSKKEVFESNTSFFICFTLIFCLVFGTFSCISLKPNSSKDAKKLYVSFYRGELGMQYFIKPLSLKGKDNTSFNVDFTFREAAANEDSVKVVMNGSLFTEKKLSKIDSLQFHFSNTTCTLNNFDILYKEKEGKNYIIRSTSLLKFQDCLSLFKQENWIFHLYSGSEKFKLVSTKKTNRAISSLYLNIFDLIVD